MQTSNHSTVPGPQGSFPVALNLSKRQCVLIGTSPEMDGRAYDLLAAGAILRVICDAPTANLLELARTGKLQLITQAIQVEDLADSWMVVLTDRDPDTTAWISAACEARRIFFCAIDQPAYSTFSHVAVARAGSLWAAVGTSGTAPALASRLRQELQRLFDESKLSRVVEKLAALRERTPTHRRREVLVSAAKSVSIQGSLVVQDAPWNEQ